MYSYGPPHMAEQEQDDQLEHTYSSYVRIRDVALKTCWRQWTIGRSSERGSGISVLAAQHDDDDDEVILKLSPFIWALYISQTRFCLMEIEMDVVLKTCWRRWTIGRSSERGSGIFVLAARHDDDEIYIYTHTHLNDMQTYKHWKDTKLPLKKLFTKKLWIVSLK